MGGYGVGEVSTGTGEQVDRIENETNLTPRPIAGSGAGGGGRIMGAETGVNNELEEVGRLTESDGKGFTEEVLG